MTSVTMEAVSERQIFLSLRIAFKTLVQRLLKTSELPGLNT